jgi:hypothetical protein
VPRLRRLLARLKPGRRTLAAGLAVLHLVACGGLPVPTPKNPAGVPFPCAGRACGCATAEACWAGACCCFTAREKLAWAVGHDFTPPAHFLRAVEREERAESDAADCPSCAAKKACCAKPAAPAAPGWLLGVSALKCKGEGAGGLLTLPPALPTALPDGFDPPPPVRSARTT